MLKNGMNLYSFFMQLSGRFFGIGSEFISYSSGVALLIV